MSQRKSPPFRADHVGSLLRPTVLKDARAKHASGEITAAALKEICLLYTSDAADE